MFYEDRLGVLLEQLRRILAWREALRANDHNQPTTLR
jgi:hypothetical protein